MLKGQKSQSKGASTHQIWDNLSIKIIMMAMNYNPSFLKIHYCTDGEEKEDMGTEKWILNNRRPTNKCRRNDRYINHHLPG